MKRHDHRCFTCRHTVVLQLPNVSAGPRYLPSSTVCHTKHCLLESLIQRQPYLVDIQPLRTIDRSPNADLRRRTHTKTKHSCHQFIAIISQSWSFHDEKRCNALIPLVDQPTWNAHIVCLCVFLVVVLFECRPCIGSFPSGADHILCFVRTKC